MFGNIKKKFLNKEGVLPLSTFFYFWFMGIGFMEIVFIGLLIFGLVGVPANREITIHIFDFLYFQIILSVFGLFAVIFFSMSSPSFFEDVSQKED